MSGLLRRLADVAAGRGQPPVRSASRAAFAGAPMLLSREAGMDALSSGSVPQPLQPPTMWLRAPAAPARDREEARTPNATVLAPGRQAPRRDPMASAGRPSDADASAGRGAPARHDLQAPQGHAIGDAVSDAAWLARAPMPLMPAPADVAPAATGAIRSAAATPSAPPAPRAAEPSEVHVTIGRIEITAVHEAPPPRRAGKAARPLTSLDDYLRQRQRAR